MKTASRQMLQVVALLSCVAVISVFGDCVSDEARSVEDRTRRVPLVIKGVVVARGQTGNPRTFTIRVGKILKGGNESVASSQVEIAVSEGIQTRGTSTFSPATPDGRASNATSIVTDDDGLADGTTVVMMTGAGELMSSTPQEVTLAPCLDGLNLLDRYIFFLQPMDKEGRIFEVVEDGLPQTRENLRRVRQTVKEEYDANDTLPEDDHRSLCTEPKYVNHYCFNGGTCAVWINQDKYFCICNYPYYGERCEHVDPALQAEDRPVVINDTTLAIAVIMSTLLVLTVICIMAYIRYKNSIWRERKREVEKTLKYLQERYPSTPSRRNSPLPGISRLNNNSAINVEEGAQQMIVFQDAEGRQSRQGSLSSTQYRLLTEVLTHQPVSHRASVDFTEHTSHRDSARSSVV
ncbi:uncharacterized protein LOC110977518 [Acanthaster planci]|uniref:Uncharacterized protein LOC110977518 n=1 Tax=Acanthaster planci TaxID=133434 RepID=A0A8B7Y524_ACAPL|nr:uncharacterized protein LOC110977518 [Acanthaster planci]